MHVFELIVTLVVGLAWPGAVLVIVLLFRDQVRELIGGIRKLKIADFSAEVERTALEAEEIRVPSTSVDLTAAYDYLPGYPAAAISDAWQEVVRHFNETQLVLDPSYEGAPGMLGSFTDSLSSFAAAGHIDPKYRTIAYSLFDLFLKAYNSPETVDASDALLYLQSVERLIEALKKAQQH